MLSLWRGEMGKNSPIAFAIFAAFFALMYVDCIRLLEQPGFYAYEQLPPPTMRGKSAPAEGMLAPPIQHILRIFINCAFEIEEICA